MYGPCVFSAPQTCFTREWRQSSKRDVRCKRLVLPHQHRSMGRLLTLRPLRTCFPLATRWRLAILLHLGALSLHLLHPHLTQKLSNPPRSRRILPRLARPRDLPRWKRIPRHQSQSLTNKHFLRHPHQRKGKLLQRQHSRHDNNLLTIRRLPQSLSDSTSKTPPPPLSRKNNASTPRPFHLQENRQTPRMGVRKSCRCQSFSSPFFAFDWCLSLYLYRYGCFT
jgi:hypothetical protein